MRCPDCDAKEGQIHAYNCDMERCPFCGGQLLSCNCMYRILGIRGDTHTEEDERKWLAVLEKKKRIPWVAIPNLCALCGEVSPEFFSVPDKEWEKFVVSPLQGQVLCLVCYEKMKRLFPKGWENAPHSRKIEKICS